MQTCRQTAMKPGMEADAAPKVAKDAAIAIATWAARMINATIQAIFIASVIAANRINAAPISIAPMPSSVSRLVGPSSSFHQFWKASTCGPSLMVQTFSAADVAVWPIGMAAIPKFIQT